MIGNRQKVLRGPERSRGLLWVMSSEFIFYLLSEPLPLSEVSQHFVCLLRVVLGIFEWWEGLRESLTAS